MPFNKKSEEMSKKRLGKPANLAVASTKAPNGLVETTLRWKMQHPTLCMNIVILKFSIKSGRKLIRTPTRQD